MNERVIVMREAVVKLTQMLAGKGIRVTQQGVQAYVEPGPNGEPARVNLPFIPDNASVELCEAIQGFLDHEVAHILFTDFKAAGKITDPTLHNMWNIIEDARIEKAMAQRFTGSGHNIATTGKFFLDKYTKPTVAAAAKKGDVNGVKAAVMVPAIRALAGQQIWKEFMANHPDMEAAVADEVAKIAHLQSKIENCSSSAEAIDVAREVLTALGSGSGGAGAGGAPKPKKAPKAAGGPAKHGEKPKGGKSSGSSSGGEEDEEQDEEEDGKAAAAASDESEEAEPDESDEGAAAGDGEDDDAAESDEEEEGDGAGAADEEEQDDDSESSTDGSSGGFFEALNKEIANGFDESMSNLITNEAVAAAKKADYLVFSKDDDLVEPLKVGTGFKSEMLKNLAESVDHMVAPLQKDLERAISARSLSVWENGRRSGRLHSGNLSRLAVGDPRVFRKKHESASKDVAVELVVDMSGSMSGSKIHTAAKAAYALASVLDRLNIKCEVICFTTGHYDWKNNDKVEEEEKLLGGKSGFSRVESLYMPILKQFNERMTSTEVRNRFGWLPHSGHLANNVDGESIGIAARRLSMRREAGKIMIVLSDGAPSCYRGGTELQHHLRETVEGAEKAGIRVVGIGIQSAEVTRFYKRHMVLNDITELPARVMKELRHLLIG